MEQTVQQMEQGLPGQDGQDGADGTNGTNGVDGQDGADGNGIATIVDNGDNTITITLDDGQTTTYTAGQDGALKEDGTKLDINHSIF